MSRAQDSLQHDLALLWAAPLVVFGLIAITKITWRLFFHPLRQFPGPTLAAATHLYGTYFELLKGPGGQFNNEIDRLHDIHGPIVRVSPDEVHVKDSDWMPVLLAGPGHVRHKSDRTNRANMSDGSVASAQHHDLHRMRRASINPYLSKQAIGRLESKLRSKVDLLCQVIGKRASSGEIVELGAAFLAVTTDIITEYAYGRDWGILETEDLGQQWKRVVVGGFAGVPLRRSFPSFVKIMERVPTWLVSMLSPDANVAIKMKAAMDQVPVQVYNEITNDRSEKTEGKVKPSTIFHGIIASDLPEEEKSIKRLADEAFVVLLAGSETTAKVTATILVELQQSPHLLTRLREEIKGSMMNGLPDLRVLEGKLLLKAVIQEGLRITSAVTNRPSLVAPDEDLQYDNAIIPRGTPISMTYSDVLFDPKIFPEPHAFNPERWLFKTEPDQRLERYLVAFGRGTRSCVGINLAYAELYLLVAAFVHRFDMELYDFDRERDFRTVRDAFVGLPSKESKGVRVNMKLRE